MLIGYARVSTADQNLDLQTDALNAAGCERIFTDTVSGAIQERPELARAMDHLRSGDVLVVWRLDRMGRSLKNLIELIATLEEKGVEFRSLTEGMDTSTSGGKLVFGIFASIAEFERNLICERTKAGLAAARVRGRMGGRRAKLTEEEKEHAAQLYREGNTTVKAICETVGISKPTLYRYVRTKHRELAQNGAK